MGYMKRLLEKEYEISWKSEYKRKFKHVWDFTFLVEKSKKTVLVDIWNHMWFVLDAWRGPFKIKDVDGRIIIENIDKP